MTIQDKIKKRIGLPTEAKPEPPVEKKRKPEMKDRLPDMSSFEAHYDADKKMWKGWLKIVGSPTFHAEVSAIFKLFSTLDDQYRAWIKEQAEEMES